jgi:hypothetical protein
LLAPVALVVGRAELIEPRDVAFEPVIEAETRLGSGGDA